MLSPLACRRLSSRYLDFVMERLPASERMRIEAHLLRCRSCRDEVEQYRRTVRLAQEAAQEPLPTPANRWETLSMRLKEESASPPRLATRYPMLAAAALSTMALLVCIALRFLPTPAPTPLRNQQTRTTPLATEKTTHTSIRPRASRPPYPVALHAARQAVKSSPMHSPIPALSDSTQRSVHAAPFSRKRTEPKEDLAFLNPDSVVRIAGWTHWPSDTLHQMERELRQMVRGGDDFVTIPLPAIAGSDSSAVRSAIASYKQDASLVDPRLVRKINLAVKGIPLSDLCSRLSQETGVTMIANRRVADDRVTIFCLQRPLRDIMRQISALFGFSWERQGVEGAYLYEVTQSLRSQLLEEGLRQKDHDEMILSLDHQMDVWRTYLGLSRDQIRKRQAMLTGRLKEKAIFAEYDRMEMLLRGGLVAANQFFRLSPAELDDLRAGKPLSWEISDGNALGLPKAVLEGIRDSFHDSIPNPGGPKPGEGKLTATLRFDVRQKGEVILYGGLETEGGGLEATLAVVKSPSFDRVENAPLHASLERDPSLQSRLAFEVKGAYTLTAPPFPDTDSVYSEALGPKVTAADVLEALYKQTGKDIIADQYLRLYAPAPFSFNHASLFDVLNRAGDALRMRWSKSDGWLQFRSLDFYYARPQQIPHRLLERWAQARRDRGMLLPEDLAEIAQLTDLQLDSVSNAQAAVACYGLQEWPVARQEEGRPHWRLFAHLPAPQRQKALSAQGIAFREMPTALHRTFVMLAEDSDGGVLPSEEEMKNARLRLIYLPTNTVFSKQAPDDALLPPGNTSIFLYSYGQPQRFSAAGPFNGIYGLSEPMLAERLHGKLPPD